jgi:hypothetical protein
VLIQLDSNKQRQGQQQGTRVPIHSFQGTQGSGIQRQGQQQGTGVPIHNFQGTQGKHQF